jgi:lipopolysaccharide export system protein LptA
LNHYLSFLLAFLLAFVPVAASAEKVDKDKPLNIEADNLVRDELQQVSIFTGRAILTKGSMVMRGGRIEIREDPDGYQYGVIFPDGPKRAFYRQKREGDEYLEGEGLRVEYDGKHDRVKLIDNAEVRRYRGVVMSDHMTGKLIIYNNLTDLLYIDGQRTEEGGKPLSNGRVRAVLAPRSKLQDTP